MTSKRFILKEPIDFDALSVAYKNERWKWQNGNNPMSIPSASMIREHVRDLSDSALNGGTGFCGSGGIEARLVNGKVVISIGEKLWRHIPKFNTTTSVQIDTNKPGGKKCCNCGAPSGTKSRCEKHLEINRNNQAKWVSEHEEISHAIKNAWYNRNREKILFKQRQKRLLQAAKTMLVKTSAQ